MFGLTRAKKLAKLYGNALLSALPVIGVYYLWSAIFGPPSDAHALIGDLLVVGVVTVVNGYVVLYNVAEVYENERVRVLIVAILFAALVFGALLVFFLVGLVFDVAPLVVKIYAMLMYVVVVAVSVVSQIQKEPPTLIHP